MAHVPMPWPLIGGQDWPQGARRECLSELDWPVYGANSGQVMGHNAGLGLQLPAQALPVSHCPGPSICNSANSTLLRSAAVDSDDLRASVRHPSTLPVVTDSVTQALGLQDLLDSVEFLSKRCQDAGRGLDLIGPTAAFKFGAQLSHASSTEVLNAR